ncbi:MAG: prefoldin subunit [Candidatus Woesearchaeota archaeon]
MNNINNEEINELSSLEQSSHQLLTQRQVFESQLIEVESALQEIETTNKTYKIIGHVMVLYEKDKLKEELNSKKEILNLRIKNIIKQEEKLKEKSNNLRKKVMTDLKKEE